MMKQKGPESGVQAPTKRKENYFANNGILDLFNFENRIREVEGPHHNKYKAFCERFKSEN